jgi:molybdopterin-guanine dinucleotide biosynthesis protein A
MGRDKSRLVLGGRTLLERVTGNLAPLVSRLRVLGRNDAPHGMEAVPDLFPGLGPLAGIHTALATAESTKVLVLACDLPFATTAFLEGLVMKLGADDLAVIPRPVTGPVPVCAVYRISCAAEAERRLRNRQLSARAFAEALPARFVLESELSVLDRDGRALFNVNTPEDFELASRLAER